MRISFVARGGPVKVSMFIPRTSPRLAVVDENFISRGFGPHDDVVNGKPPGGVGDPQGERGAGVVLSILGPSAGTSGRANHRQETREPTVTTISYWSFFSIFPLLLVFVTILNIVLRENPELREDLVDGALGQVPVIGTQLADSQTALTGSWVTITIGVVTALWAGLAAASALQTALEEIWDTPMFERPNGAIQRAKSLAFLVMLAVGMCVSTLAINATSFVDDSTVTLVIGLVVTFVVNLAVLLGTFRLLISGPNPLRELLPGAIVAAALSVALQTLGTLVVTRYITGASDTFGTFAIVIACC